MNKRILSLVVIALFIASIASSAYAQTLFPTDTPVSTNTPTSVPTNTAVPTNTPTNIPTSTSVPTNTPTNTPTSTSVPTNTPTNTPTETVVSTETPTNTPTDTPSITETPTSTPTVTPTEGKATICHVTNGQGTPSSPGPLFISEVPASIEEQLSFLPAVPPGIPGLVFPIVIDFAALAAHLAHGDFFPSTETGLCENGEQCVCAFKLPNGHQFEERPCLRDCGFNNNDPSIDNCKVVCEGLRQKKPTGTTVTASSPCTTCGGSQPTCSDKFFPVVPANCENKNPGDACNTNPGGLASNCNSECFCPCPSSTECSGKNPFGGSTCSTSKVTNGVCSGTKPCECVCSGGFCNDKKEGEACKIPGVEADGTCSKECGCKCPAASECGAVTPGNSCQVPGASGVISKCSNKCGCKCPSGDCFDKAVGDECSISGSKAQTGGEIKSACDGTCGCKCPSGTGAAGSRPGDACTTSNGNSGTVNSKCECESADCECAYSKGSEFTSLPPNPSGTIDFTCVKPADCRSTCVNNPAVACPAPPAGFTFRGKICLPNAGC